MPQDKVKNYLDVLNGLNELGYNLVADIHNADEAKRIHRDILSKFPNQLSTFEPCYTSSFSGFLIEFGALNQVLLRLILEFSVLLDMNDEEIETYLESIKKLRDFLINLGPNR
jgi:hypothetical protein